MAESFPSKSHPLLHVFSPPSFHDDAFILANRKALEKLHAALGDLLAGRGTLDASGAQAFSAGFWANDGEGYNLTIIMDDNEERWHRAQPPYTEEFAQSSREDQLHPTKIISRETYMKEHQRGVDGL